MQSCWKQEAADLGAFCAKELWLLLVGEGEALEGLTAQIFQTSLCGGSRAGNGEKWVRRVIQVQSCSPDHQPLFWNKALKTQVRQSTGGFFPILPHLLGEGH